MLLATDLLWAYPDALDRGYPDFFPEARWVACIGAEIGVFAGTLPSVTGPLDPVPDSTERYRSAGSRPAASFSARQSSRSA
jgi:hypothetical protein